LYRTTFEPQEPQNLETLEPTNPEPCKLSPLCPAS
jgi:hypothetical protein